MAKGHSTKLSSAFKNLDELMATPEGRGIAQDFGDQCANMKIVEAVRISRLLELSFQAGKKMAAAEARAALTAALKQLS